MECKGFGCCEGSLRKPWLESQRPSSETSGKGEEELKIVNGKFKIGRGGAGRGNRISKIGDRRSRSGGGRGSTQAPSSFVDPVGTMQRGKILDAGCWMRGFELTSHAISQSCFHAFQIHSLLCGSASLRFLDVRSQVVSRWRAWFHPSPIFVRGPRVKSQTASGGSPRRRGDAEENSCHESGRRCGPTGGCRAGAAGLR